MSFPPARTRPLAYAPGQLCSLQVPHSYSGAAQAHHKGYISTSIFTIRGGQGMTHFQNSMPDLHLATEMDTPMSYKFTLNLCSNHALAASEKSCPFVSKKALYSKTCSVAKRDWCSWWCTTVFKHPLEACAVDLFATYQTASHSGYECYPAPPRIYGLPVRPFLMPCLTGVQCLQLLWQAHITCCGDHAWWGLETTSNILANSRSWTLVSGTSARTWCSSDCRSPPCSRGSWEFHATLETSM